MKTTSLECGKCHEVTNVEDKITILGFPKMKCPKCNHDNRFPLRGRRRSFYGIVIFFGSLSFIWSMAIHKIPSGILLVATICAVYAIYYDNKLIKNSRVKDS